MIVCEDALLMTRDQMAKVKAAMESMGLGESDRLSLLSKYIKNT